jgi:hypothetical protein
MLALSHCPLETELYPLLDHAALEFGKGSGDLEHQLACRRGGIDTREKKSARELANMVASGIGVGGVAVVVHKDPAYGWHPTVMTAPAQAIGAQLRAEQVAKELRERFVLAD